MDKNWTTWNTQAMQALDRGDIEQAERAFRQACPLRVVSALYRAIKPRKGAGAPPHHPDVSLRGPEGAVAISQYPAGSQESPGKIVTAFPRLPRRPAASSQ